MEKVNMSRSVEILIKSGKSFDEILKLIESIARHKFSKNTSVEWNLYELQFFGINIAMFEADFEDDLGIEFSKYKFALSFSCINMISEKYYDQLQKSFSIMIAETIHQEHNLEVIVVDDMQIILESFLNS